MLFTSISPFPSNFTAESKKNCTSLASLKLSSLNAYSLEKALLLSSAKGLRLVNLKRIIIVFFLFCKKHSFENIVRKGENDNNFFFLRLYSAFFQRQINVTLIVPHFESCGAFGLPNEKFLD